MLEHQGSELGFAAGEKSCAKLVRLGHRCEVVGSQRKYCTRVGDVPK
jgi:hypothetical protein